MSICDEPARVNFYMIGMIARSVGIVAIALGFVIGIYGLDETGAWWLQIALGLLVTGMLAQGCALYCSIKRMQQRHDKPEL